MRIFQPLPDVSQSLSEPARQNRFSVNRTAGTMPVFKPKVEIAAFTDESKTPAITDKKPGFGDLIDVINPLQHIPVVGMVYRRLTGDTISAPAQFMGGALFGGPIGAAIALADVAVRGKTGLGMGDSMLAMTGYETSKTPLETSTRKSEPPRMAGTIPVWRGNDPLGSETKFAMLLNDLNSNTPNMS